VSKFEVTMAKVVVDKFVDRIWKGYAISQNDIKKIINVCLQCTGVEANQVFLNISFVNDDTMIEYNKKFHGKDGTTNVLSFENENKFIGNNLYLGEIVLCYNKIVEETQQFHKSFKDRLWHLFVHGVLHTLGYDHIKDNDRAKMEALEVEILKTFGIVDIYETVC
jgi:probable rRNA maturation factor